MIVDTVKGDILESPHKHIAFAINTEGINDSGFAGLVARRFWPELAYIGASKLGTVLTKTILSGPTFHALVCHSLAAGGWDGTPEHVTRCLDTLSVPEGETVAIVGIGTGPVGRLGGADADAIREGIARSETQCAVYTL